MNTNKNQKIWSPKDKFGIWVWLMDHWMLPEWITRRLTIDTRDISLILFKFFISTSKSNTFQMNYQKIMMDILNRMPRARMCVCVLMEEWNLDSWAAWPHFYKEGQSLYNNTAILEKTEKIPISIIKFGIGTEILWNANLFFLRIMVENKQSSTFFWLSLIYRTFYI